MQNSGEAPGSRQKKQIALILKQHSSLKKVGIVEENYLHMATAHDM